MNLPKSPTRIIDPGAAVVRQSGRGRLAVVRGPDRGESFVLESGVVVIGSGSQCQIQLSDPTVSRKHLEAELAEDGLVVKDLGSTNGSYVRGARFRELLLGYGAEIQIGHSFVKFVPDEETVELTPAAEESFGALIGRDDRMRQLFSLLQDVARTDATVLLEGETGSGKELFAEEIHRHSSRADKPFVVFDCASVPRELIESALFGHVRGAFTGAIEKRMGAFLQADGGTLFLDEIGELALELQPTLLRVLDKRIVRPVGGDESHRVDVRVIAATNRDLRDEVSARRFREDLYYRLAVVRVSVPPLRERTSDIAPLVQSFLEQMAPERAAVLREGDIERLEKHRWPGNVRELRNVVERVLALSHGEALDFASALLDMGTPAPSAGGDVGTDLPFKAAKAKVVERFESEYLRALLQEHGGNLSAAARGAELDRKHLRELLRKYGLRGEE